MKAAVRVLAWLFLGVNAYGGFVVTYVLTVGAALEARTNRVLSEAGKQRELVRALEVTLAKHDLFQAEVEELERKLGVLRRILPASPGMEQVQESLQSVGQGSGVELLEVTPGPAQPRDFHAVLPLAVRVRGGLPALAAFTDRLERSPRLLLVKRLAAAREGGSFTASLEVQAFQRTGR